MSSQSAPILTVGTITGSEIYVSWTGAEDATSFSYIVDGVEDTGASFGPSAARFANLTPLTEYDIIIRAIYTDSENTVEVPSATTSVTTGMPDPPTLPVLEATVISTTQINISWTGGYGATSYTYLLNNVAVTPSVNNGIIDNTAVLDVSSNITSFTIVVTAVNIAASTSSEPVTILTLPPTKPVLLETISTGGKFAYISWTGGDGATSYTYTITGSSHEESSFLDNGLSGKSIGIKISPEDVLSEYSVIITATNVIGSTNSDPIATGIAQSGFLQNINSLTTYNVTSSGFTLSWYDGRTFIPTQKIYEYSIATDTSNNTIIPTSVSLENHPFTATFTGLTLSSQNYNIILKITAFFNFGGEIANKSETTSLTFTQVDPPTQPVVTVGTVTGTTISISWTGGDNATSYTYALESVTGFNDLQMNTPVLLDPTNDNGLEGKSATYTGLTPSTTYNITVTAVNSGGSLGSVVSTTTSAPPAPPTAEAITQLKDTFNSAIIAAGSGSSAAEQVQAASSAINAAIAANVAPATLVAAALTASISSPAVLTALVDSPVFIGATISVSSAVAQTLYASFAVQTIDTTLPLTVNFPAADGSVTAPAAGANSKLAIDLNGTDKYVPFRGTTGYGIRLTNGVQRFVTPTDVSGTVVSTGDVLTFTLTGGATLSFTVADLDIVLAPYTAPPSIVCFLGSAPVLTPSGYRRIDRIELGDLVCTPTGTAKVEAIKKQSYKASKFTNPYVIPEGTYNANRRLLISPRHKVAVNGKMIEAKDLGLEQEAQKGDIIYYNLQITKTSNMIVAGVEVESLAPLVRITISREAFNYILATRHGGVLTEEIKSKCRFLPDGTVSVPSIKN